MCYKNNENKQDDKLTDNDIANHLKGFAIYKTLTKEPYNEKSYIKILSKLDNIKYYLKLQLKKGSLLSNDYFFEIKRINKAEKIIKDILLSYGISERG